MYPKKNVSTDTQTVEFLKCSKKQNEWRTEMRATVYQMFFKDERGRKDFILFLLFDLSIVKGSCSIKHFAPCFQG